DPAVGPDADATDDFFLRRMRFYIEGSVTENWSGIWQVDFGKESENPAIKDAYIQYSGLSAGKIIIGNHNAPFSRELLTSSKRQQLVERTFVGDHNYGTPDRQMGISIKGGDNFQYQVGVYNAGIDPSTSKLDWESRTSEDAEYFGYMVAGRLDFYPMGKFKKAQGDFARDKFQLGVGVNAYTWSNDDDTYAGADPAIVAPGEYESVTGYGADVAVRGAGLSVDAEYNSYSSDTNSDSFSGGLIEDGSGDFATYSVEGGFMVVPSKLEIVAGYQGLDADAWDETWTRMSIGANWFFSKHKDKIQFEYQMGDDVQGVKDDEETIIYVQFQHVF
ncbi:MAG: porin, partial [Pseudomonadota bacterium]|nr:porin [Pseudomonadota bacterium]